MGLQSMTKMSIKQALCVHMTALCDDMGSHRYIRRHGKKVSLARVLERVGSTFTHQSCQMPLRWAGYPQTGEFEFMAKIAKATASTVRALSGGNGIAHGG